MSTCQTKIVDVETAKLYLKSASFALQRRLSNPNVMRLEAEMRAGRFVPGTPVYFAVFPDKSQAALNGQHTLNAIVSSGVSTELTLIHHDVKSQAEAAALYARMDLQKRRSWRDRLRALGKEDWLDESTAWSAALPAALRFMFEKFRAARNDNQRELARIQALQSGDVMAQAMDDAKSAAEKYIIALGGDAVDLKLYRRASIMGVGVEIMRYRAVEGHEFFRSLAADDGLRAGDPQRALLRYIREHKASSAPDREAQAMAVALAWNAFYENRKLDIVKPGAAGYFRIMGTPWENKDFDPIREYCRDCFFELDEPAGETTTPEEPSLLGSESAPAAETVALPQPKRRRRKGSEDGRDIQIGVDHNMQPVTIFDHNPDFTPERTEGEQAEGEHEPVSEPDQSERQDRAERDEAAE